MMVAALTPNIRNNGMVAFIRTFAKQAHMQWRKSSLYRELSREPSSSNLSKGRKQEEQKKREAENQARANREYGVAFLLYTGQIKTWQRAKESKLNLLDDSYDKDDKNEWISPYYFRTYPPEKTAPNSHVLALIYKPILDTIGAGCVFFNDSGYT